MHAVHAGATLADPMCGSGTFLIEAALMATNTAPGLFRRRFPFQGWHDFDRQAYASVCEQARKAQTPWEGALLGNEIHPGALSLASRSVHACSAPTPMPKALLHLRELCAMHELRKAECLSSRRDCCLVNQRPTGWLQSLAAWAEICTAHAFQGLPWCKQSCGPRRDAEGAGVAHLMHLHQGSCGEWQPRQRPDQVITNPPWGNRLMDAEADDSSALEATWTELGLFLKVSVYLH